MSLTSLLQTSPTSLFQTAPNSLLQLSISSLITPPKKQKKSKRKFGSLASFSPQLCAIDEDTKLTPKSTPTLSIKSSLQKLLDQKQTQKKLNPAACEFVPTFTIEVVEPPKKQVIKPIIKPIIKPTYKKLGKFMPAFKPRAKLNIYIGKRETKVILDKLNEKFTNTSMLYHYLDVSTAFQMTDNQMYLYQTTVEPMISFINFDLHLNNGNQLLYGIILPNDKARIQKCNDINTGVQDAKWLWKLDSFLTAKEIYNKYGIPVQYLPKSSRDIRKFKQYMTRQININIDALNKVNWYGHINKFASSSRSKKAQKNILKLRYNEWMNQCTESWNDCSAIPIIVFENNNDTGFKYWVEWLKFIYVKQYNCYIGVSFKENKNGNGCVFEAIYLNKTDILNKHLLFGCTTDKYEKYFDKFNVSITDIQWI